MEYNQDDIYNKSIELAKDSSYHFIEDIIAFLPCGKTTFYTLFPADSDGLNDIKECLEKNKIETKAKIRKKMMEGRGVDLISLYKLIGSEEERDALNSQKIDHTTKGDKITPPSIHFTSASDKDK